MNIHRVKMVLRESCSLYVRRLPQMSDTRNLVRGGGIGAVVAAVIYLTFSVSSLQGGMQGDGGGNSFLDPAFGYVLASVALLGQLAAIASLHVLQKERYGRLGATGALVAFVGFGLQLMVQLIGIVTGLILLEGAVLAYLGILTPFVGLVILGIATIRAQMLPRWFGVLLIIGFPVVAVLLGVPDMELRETLTGVALANFWGLVGYVLLSRGTQSQRSAGVR
jgi:hypothetical protein